MRGIDFLPLFLWCCIHNNFLLSVKTALTLLVSVTFCLITKVHQVQITFKAMPCLVFEKWCYLLDEICETQLLSPAAEIQIRGALKAIKMCFRVTAYCCALTAGSITSSPQYFVVLTLRLHMDPTSLIDLSIPIRSVQQYIDKYLENQVTSQS